MPDDPNTSEDEPNSTALLAQALERCAALEGALRDVLGVINPKDHRPHAEQLLIFEARLLLGRGRL